MKLRPDYADAYTNIALTEIQWEKYDSARATIQRALALSPKNARALYYLALLQRRAGDYDAETANLKRWSSNSLSRAMLGAILASPFIASMTTLQRESSLRRCSRSTRMT